MFSRENLDWIKEAPKMSYNETLGRPVFMNAEAFYVCLSGVSDRSIFNDVEFELDENFEKFYKEQTGEETANPQLVSQFIGDMVAGAKTNYQSLKLDEGMDIFRVPTDEPDTENPKEIEWYNTENLEKMNQKFNKKINEKTDMERLDPEIAMQMLGNELAKEGKTLAEYHGEFAPDADEKFFEAQKAANEARKAANEARKEADET